MTGKQKKQLAVIVVSIALFIAALILEKRLDAAWWVKLLVMAVPWLFAGREVLFEAAEKLFSGQVFDEDLLMTVASLGALALCVVEKDAHEAHEAAAIMIFFRVGELFESIAVGKSRRNVSSLLAIMPDKACVERGGERVEVAPEEVEVGEIIAVLPGDRLPLDGEVIEGMSELDTSSLTGESLPRAVGVGDSALSGCINLSGALRVKVTKPAGESTVSRILELVENAGANKAQSESFISKFARVYTPAVTISALLLAVVPSLYVGFTSGSFAFAQTWRPFVHAALMFLIVSCPCALVISVPMSFFGGIGGACAKGILIKGSAFVETFARCGTAIFDKTGTLTTGSFAVRRVLPEKMSGEELLRYAAAAERYSSHPLAAALREACQKDDAEAHGHREEAGKGVFAVVEGKSVAAGNRRLMESLGLSLPEIGGGSVVFLAIDGQYAGCVLVGDELKDDTAETLHTLSQRGIQTVILTGDTRENAEESVKNLDFGALHAGLLPADKLELASRLQSEKKEGTSVCFVGDGINDAPVLAGVDVGIAMGALGSDAAVEAADIVLMNDRPSDVVRALDICKKTVRIVRQNVIFALAVKFAVLLLLGLMTFVPALAPLEGFAGELAVFADVGVSVLAILNAMRALR